jgi:hypothetical protein
MGRKDSHTVNALLAESKLLFAQATSRVSHLKLPSPTVQLPGFTRPVMPKRARASSPTCLANKVHRVAVRPRIPLPFEVIAIILAMACASTETMLAMRTVCLEWSKEIPETPQCWRHIEYVSGVCSSSLHMTISRVARFIQWNRHSKYTRENAPLCRRVIMKEYTERYPESHLMNENSIVRQLDELIITGPAGCVFNPMTPMPRLLKMALKTQYAGYLITRMAPSSFSSLAHLTLDSGRRPGDMLINVRLDLVSLACPRLESMEAGGVYFEIQGDDPLPLPRMKTLSLIHSSFSVSAFKAIFVSLEILRLRVSLVRGNACMEYATDLGGPGERGALSMTHGTANLIADSFPSLSELAVNKVPPEYSTPPGCSNRLLSILKFTE